MNKSEYGRFDFVGKTGLYGGISLFFVIASLVYLAINGINYGIDFRGGTEVQVRFGQPVTIDQVRGTVEKLSLGDVGVQSFGDQNEYVIRFQNESTKLTEKEMNDQLNASIEKIKTAIATELQSSQPEIRRIDTVGPQVGGELKKNGILAIFYCLLVILIYIAFRFDPKYAPAAVLCLIHDAIITLAIYVAVGKEVNISALAAILTLMGYSLNDTIVVFDRIRENVQVNRGTSLAVIINKAVNDMIGRTVITSGSLFLSALCLFIFGTGIVADIAFAISVGIFFGTYSSIYVAAPLVLLVDHIQSKKSVVSAA